MTTDDVFKSTRKEYTQGVLDETLVAPDPLEQFKGWYNEAVVAEPHEPNACALATVGRDLKPSSRIVLLKGLDERGFAFFTNYESRKGVQIEENPHAALLFYWGSQERSVRIEGCIEKVSDEESMNYFASRPRSAQLSALLSRQSAVAPSRKEMEQALDELDQRYAGQPIPRPPHWGGYRLKPEVYEFWQGRENRLHDRIRYTKTLQGWRVERLWS